MWPAANDVEEGVVMVTGPGRSPQLQELFDKAHMLPFGPACSAAWAQAVTAAQDEADDPSTVEALLQLVLAYTMGGRTDRSLAPFVQLDALYRSKPEVFNDEQLSSFGWDFKYALSAVRGLPSVSCEQWEMLLESMREFYVAQGESLRPYYYRRASYAWDMGDEEGYKEFHARWKAAARGELSDCAGCEPAFDMMYALRMDDVDAAVVAGELSLANADNACDRNPEETLSLMMEPWFMQGHDGRAWAAHCRSYRRFQQNSADFDQLALHYRYLGLSGLLRPERLERGVGILLRHLPWWSEVDSADSLMDAAADAAVLLACIPEAEQDQVLNVTLPGSSLPWCVRPDVPQPTVRVAGQWFKDLALDLADLFDARPGHPNPGVHRRRVLEAFTLPAPDELPEIRDVASSDGVIDVSGVFDPQARGLGMSGALIVDDSPESVEDDAAVDDEPAKVPLRFRGPWDDLSLAELKVRDAAINAVHNCDEYTVFGVLAEQREAAELIEARQVDVDAAAAALPPEFAQVDPAFELLARSDKHLEAGELVEAATLADQATRMDSIDPIGVRLSACGTLAIAASSAGYPEEAVEAHREAINVAAALGAPLIQAQIAARLADDLLGLRRFWEAAEVANNGLDALERLFGASYPAVAMPVAATLNVCVAAASASVDQHGTAARSLEKAAVLAFEHVALADASDEVRQEARAAAARHFDDAASGYNQAMMYEDAVRCRHRCVQMSVERLREVLKQHGTAGGTDASERSRSPEVRDAVRTLASVRSRYGNDLAEAVRAGHAEHASTLDEVMEQQRVHLLTYADVFERSPQWLEADWLRDRAVQFFVMNQHISAADAQRAAITAFIELGDRSEVIDSWMGLSHMYRARGELRQAHAAAEEAAALGSREASRLAAQIDQEME